MPPIRDNSSDTTDGPRTIAVLDIGKTHIRVCVCDEEGNVLESASRESASLPAPPYPHLAVDDTYEWLLDTLRGFDEPERIETLVPVAHGATAALLAGEELALPIVDYEWTGVDEIESTYPRPAFEETASPALPAGLNLGRQLYWQAQTQPEAWARATDLLLYPQYWAWRFSGVKASEVTSLGCHSDLWNPARRELSSLWTSTRGAEGALSQALLPARQSAWMSLGPPTLATRERTGLPATCRVLCGIHDSNASYFSHRVHRDEPFAVVSSGTWVVVMAHDTELAALEPERDMLANVDVFGSPVATARFMGGREYVAIAGSAASGAPATLAELTSVISKGALAIPAFADQGGPFPNRRGELLAANTLSALERVALASLYLALETDLCLELLGARDDLVVEGPLAQNEVYLASLAALRPTQNLARSMDETGTLRGAVQLALWPHRMAPIALGAVPSTGVQGLTAYRDLWRNKAKFSREG